MRFRSILAGLVLVLLLSISCVASACEISCDSKALGSGCHHVSSASAAPAVAGMTDCGMGKSHHFAQVHANDQCKHAVCEQQPQTVESDQTVLHTRSITTLQALVTIFVSSVSTLHVWIEPANTASSRVPLLVALQMTLRV